MGHGLDLALSRLYLHPVSVFQLVLGGGGGCLRTGSRSILSESDLGLQVGAFFQGDICGEQSDRGAGGSRTSVRN